LGSLEFVFKSSKLPRDPRNPQQQSSTGQAKDGQAEETQCVLHAMFALCYWQL